ESRGRRGPSQQGQRSAASAAKGYFDQPQATEDVVPAFHWNVAPVVHMRCRMTASLRATAIVAFLRPMRLPRASPQVFSAFGRDDRLSNTLAASNRPPRDLRRCAPRQGGAVAEGQQDRRQRRPRSGADHARRLVPRGDGEGPRLPSRACTAGSTRPDRVADNDAEELCGRNLEEIRPGVTQSLPRPFPAAGPPAVRGPPVLPTNN